VDSAASRAPHRVTQQHSRHTGRERTRKPPTPARSRNQVLQSLTVKRVKARQAASPLPCGLCRARLGSPAWDWPAAETLVSLHAPKPNCETRPRIALPRLESARFARDLLESVEATLVGSTLRSIPAASSQIETILRTCSCCEAKE